MLVFFFEFLLHVHLDYAPSQGRVKLVEEEDKRTRVNPASGLDVVLLPKIDHLVDLVAFDDAHVFLFGRIQAFNDGSD